MRDHYIPDKNKSQSLFRHTKRIWCTSQENNALIQYLFEYLLAQSTHQPKGVPMKLIIASLLVASFTLVAEAKDAANRQPNQTQESEDVCTDESTAGMIQCAGKEMKVVRQNIATKLRKIRSAIDAMYKEERDQRTEIKSRLQKAHMSYKEYAVAECSLNSTQMLGGSGERMIFAGCYTAKMREHMKHLDSTLQMYQMER